MTEELLDFEQLAARYQREISWFMNRYCCDACFPKPAGKRLRNRFKSRQVVVFRPADIEQYLASYKHRRGKPLQKERTPGKNTTPAGVEMTRQELFNQQALKFITQNPNLTLKPRTSSGKRSSHLELISNKNRGPYETHTL